MIGSAGSAQDRLAEVVAAAVEVAAEAGESGRWTGEVARTLTAVVGKVGARITVDAEIRGFSSGWQEAARTGPGVGTGTGIGAEAGRFPRGPVPAPPVRPVRTQREGEAGP
ncbi:hypothetical protein [Streptomyces sp. CAU 1734]|uniref:hypothetical protein n=1 Tax=Streptomyces sp. CAU 1734 TaxID=3140360 RepID=UPI003261C1D1